MLTLVAAVEDARESVGTLEVEKGGDGEDQEQADQQCPQKKRGCHAGPSCSKSTRAPNGKWLMRNMAIILPAAAVIESLIIIHDHIMP